ncbi:MAG: hypothetical protein GX046_05465 [Tissierellia bacterium]|nr:hypothetical protein [Tissierellia bacterium]
MKNLASDLRIHASNNGAEKVTGWSAISIYMNGLLYRDLHPRIRSVERKWKN